MRKIDETASVTLTLAQWNTIFVALFDAQDYAESKDYPTTAKDYAALRKLIEAQGDLSRRTRIAFAEDFPELREVQAKTDAAIERQAARTKGNLLSDDPEYAAAQAATQVPNIPRSDVEKQVLGILTGERDPFEV
jgi:hypothetical protein